MRGVYKNVVIDPPPNEQLYLEEGSKNVELRNLALDGWTFYLRGSTDILIEDGIVGNTIASENNKVGAAYKSAVLCERIVIRGITFHDMLTNNPANHHEALFICDSDDVLIENCVFGPNIWANTADLYFTAEQTLHLTSNVVIRGNHFLPPSNGSRRDAIQWHDKLPAPAGMDPIDGYLLEGNLFDNCGPCFGTIKRPVSNFHVGVNYGECTQTQYDHAIKMGITFEEYPFRPAAEWPGHVTPVPPDPTDPCADVKAELAVATDALATSEAQIEAMQNQIDQAILILEGGGTSLQEIAQAVGARIGGWDLPVDTD